MRRLALVGAALIAISVGASASSRQPQADDQALARALDGRIAGKAEHCIDQRRVTGPESFGDRTVLYRQSGRRVWINQLRDRCPFLSGDQIIVVETYGLQLCRHDRFAVYTRSSPIPSGYCYLGDFTPYDRPKQK